MNARQKKKKDKRIHLKKLAPKQGEYVVVTFNPNNITPYIASKYFYALSSDLPSGVGAIMLPDSMNLKVMSPVIVKKYLDKGYEILKEREEDNGELMGD